MNAEVKLSFSDPKIVKAIQTSIEKREGGRVKEEIISKGNSLIVNFEAQDLTALRAALNSYMAWLKLACEFGGVKSGSK